MKKRLIIPALILILVLMAGIYWIYTSNPSGFFYFHQDPRDKELSSYMKKTGQFIQDNRLDSAANYLRLILARENDSTTDLKLVDSAHALQWQVKQIGLLDTGNIYIGILMQLNDQEYEDFLNRRLVKKYLGHPDLNRLFLEKLYRKSQPWDQTTPEAGNQSNSTVPSASGNPAQVRRLLAESIKSSFSDLGFDISVEIKGEDSTKLVLIAPEFDDRWFEKFENDSDMAEWQHMGFTQVEIRNGSGYVKVKNW